MERARRSGEDRVAASAQARSPPPAHLAGPPRGRDRQPGGRRTPRPGADHPGRRLVRPVLRNAARSMAPTPPDQMPVELPTERAAQAPRHPMGACTSRRTKAAREDVLRWTDERLAPQACSPHHPPRRLPDSIEWSRWGRCPTSPDRRHAKPPCKKPGRSPVGSPADRKESPSTQGAGVRLGPERWASDAPGHREARDGGEPGSPEKALNSGSRAARRRSSCRMQRKVLHPQEQGLGAGIPIPLVMGITEFPEASEKNPGRSGVSWAVSPPPRWTPARVERP